MKKSNARRDRYQSEPIKKWVRDITKNAQFTRLFNTLQCDENGCVDYSKPVDFNGFRNMLFWDIVEYMTDSEWGETFKERLQMIKMKKYDNREKIFDEFEFQNNI
jgi:hypothetical protein